MALFALLVIIFFILWYAIGLLYTSLIYGCAILISIIVYIKDHTRSAESKKHGNNTYSQSSTFSNNTGFNTTYTTNTSEYYGDTNFTNYELSGDNLINDYLNHGGSSIGVVEGYGIKYDMDYIITRFLTFDGIYNGQINYSLYDKIYGGNYKEEYDKAYDDLQKLDGRFFSFSTKLKIKNELDSKMSKLKEKIDDITNSNISRKKPIDSNIIGDAIFLLYNNDQWFGIRYSNGTPNYFMLQINRRSVEVCGEYLGYTREEPSFWDDDGTRPIYAKSTADTITSIGITYFENYEEMISYIIYKNINYDNLLFMTDKERTIFENLLPS